MKQHTNWVSEIKPRVGVVHSSRNGANWLHMRHYGLLLLLFPLATISAASAAPAATPERLDLGRTSTGATVTFIRAQAGWSINVHTSGSLELSQQEPARIEASDGSVEKELDAAYSEVSRTPDGVEASVAIHDGTTVSFVVRDLWQLHDDVVSVQRTVTVQGSAPGGFSSAIVFSAPKIGWGDASYLAPGVRRPHL